MNTNKIIIDAANGVVGRIASYAAKQALLGKTIEIVNCNNAILLGKKSMIIEKYKRARARGGAIMKGPNFPKSPEKIMKRTIRGMLKYKRGRGCEALKKIKCYNGIPEELKNVEKISMQANPKTTSITLLELSNFI